MRAMLNAGTGIPLDYANRHGLITGATGTGKTVSLMRLVEQFSRAGVPSFVADVKGDIAALARSCPVDLLDLFGTSGRPIRLTFDAMGADLVSRALELSDAQAGAVEIAFAYARDHGLAVGNLPEMRALLGMVLQDRAAVAARYGQVGAASIGVVSRALLRLESQGAARAFAYPSFDVADLLAAPDRVSILAADKLIEAPRLYGAFLLFVLEELYKRMPECGDLDKPRLVLFFDESHLLFDDCPAPLLRRIEQTVRLIRSKGVGVYFATQSHLDVPETIRAQLAHVIAHDRALPVGTARVRTMTLDGRPAVETVERVALPDCPLGALDESERPAWVSTPEATPAPKPTGEFDGYGYAFLAIVAMAIGGLVWAWFADGFLTVVVWMVVLIGVGWKGVRGKPTPYSTNG